jgi:hypothetical protein
MSGNPQRAEVAGPDLVVSRGRVRLGSGVEALDQNRVGAHTTGEHGTCEEVTVVTPGSLASSSSIRSNSTAERSGKYPFRAGDTLSVATWSISSPRSTRLTLMRLFVKTPAMTRSTIDSATCTVASTVRKRADLRPPAA